ncbi:MAG: hypothetical protein QGH94_07625 [Phycisphaerae bacterium]|nr:hypothetical protein [Phycisphaerae bacterium]
MKYAISFAAALCGLLLVSGASRADIRIVSDRNEGDAASGKFKFDKVPSPRGGV